MSLRDWARLVRLPNLPTPLADIGLGVVIALTLGNRVEPIPALLIGVASLLLYAAGMVLNDWCDREEDAKWRPDRPIPAGSIRPLQALLAGLAMAGGGLAFTGLVDFGSINHSGSFPVAICLTGMILFYDAWAKGTPLGPLAMGACRGLNVLLGATVGSPALRLTGIDPLVLFLPVVNSFLYISGVTWFARTEERQSRPLQLGLATLVILLALGLACILPFITESGFETPTQAAVPLSLMGVILLVLSPKLFAAWKLGTPQSVQSAVGWLLAFYIPFQSAQASALIGPWGILILALFPLVLLLRRWRWMKAT